MPRIEIYDASDTPYRIDTFDPVKLHAWLAEWAPRLYHQDYPLRMSIQPLFGPDGPDWNADTRFSDWFEVPWEPYAIMARIDQQRKAIEQAKAEGAKHL